MPTPQVAMRDELNRLIEDIEYTEKAHFAEERWYAGWATTGGWIAATSSALAAATLLRDCKIVTGFFALLATIVAAMLTVSKPSERSAQHLVAGRSLGALRVRIRQARDLVAAFQDPFEVTEWAGVAADFAKEKVDIDGTSAAVSERAFNAARKKIKKGHFVHDSVGSDGES